MDKVKIFPNINEFTSSAVLKTPNKDINNIVNKYFGREYLETPLVIKVTAPKRIEVPKWSPSMLQKMRDSYIKKTQEAFMEQFPSL